MMFNRCCLTLSDAQNAFWGINNTDVHVATSFDRLHAYIGLLQHHLIPQLKIIVKSLGRSTAVNIEERYSGLHLK